MRTTQSFFISVGIHLGLAVLLLMTAGIIHKNLSPSPEKTKLKIMLSTPESSTTPPTPHLVEPKPKEPIQKPQLQEPLKQPKIVPQAVVPLPIQSKPAPSVIQTTQTLSVPAPKTVEPVAVAAPKAPPSPPKVEENYEEENLGKIRSILAERLKYPKNALRLKQQGECMVAFTLEPTREVHHITVIQSSGFEMLDNAAKELIETSANEFPKPKKSVRISVPISYKLR